MQAPAACSPAHRQLSLPRWQALYCNFDITLIHWTGMSNAAVTDSHYSASRYVAPDTYDMAVGDRYYQWAVLFATYTVVVTEDSSLAYRNAVSLGEQRYAEL